MTRKSVGAAVLAALWALPCLAMTPPPKEGSAPIVICYWAKAIVAGVSKCDPPSTLVGAVFGGCSNYEDQVRRGVMEDPTSTQSEWEREKVADIAIRRIHERMASQVQGWILDAQTSDQSLCKEQK
jgi:hypothetical protein